LIQEASTLLKRLEERAVYSTTREDKRDVQARGKNNQWKGAEGIFRGSLGLANQFVEMLSPNTPTHLANANSLEHTDLGA